MTVSHAHRSLRQILTRPASTGSCGSSLLQAQASCRPPAVHSQLSVDEASDACQPSDTLMLTSVWMHFMKLLQNVRGVRVHMWALGDRLGGLGITDRCSSKLIRFEINGVGHVILDSCPWDGMSVRQRYLGPSKGDSMGRIRMLCKQDVSRAYRCSKRMCTRIALR